MSVIGHARVIRSRMASSGGQASDAVAHRSSKALRGRRKRPRLSLEGPPGSQPEVRALDEAIQGRGELGAALRFRELEGGVVAAEDGVGHAENAGRRVRLEAAEPGLVRLPVHPEADDDPVVRPTLLDRGLADALDQHNDSVAMERDKSQAARLKQEPWMAGSG